MGGPIDWTRAGVKLGRRATLVSLSSAFCRPCVQTRRVLDEVADLVDGVAHADVDAEAHLGLVRALDVTTTPTTLIVTPDGAVARRATGVPHKAEVIAALGAVLT